MKEFIKNVLGYGLVLNRPQIACLGISVVASPIVGFIYDIDNWWLFPLGLFAAILLIWLLTD